MVAQKLIDPFESNFEVSANRNKKMIMSKTKMSMALFGVLTLINHAVADNSNARIAGMAGVGVASSHYDTASSTNPALLAVHDESDDVAIILPSIGAEASDKDDVLDAIDDISDLFDSLENDIDNGNTGSANASKDQILDKLADVNQSPVTIRAGVGASVSVPSSYVSMAFALSGRADVAAVVNFDSADRGTIDAAIVDGDSSQLDDIDSSAIGLGVTIQEVSISFAKDFEYQDYQYSIGVSPKYQKVDTYLYQTIVSDANTDDFDNDEFSRSDSNVNIDFGAAMFFSETITFGLNVRDIISQEYDTITSITEISDSYELKPLVTAGVAYSTDLFTAAIDLDLTKTGGFSLVDDSQMARVGAEFNAWDWAQFRIGYRHDIKDSRDDVATVGLALSPFDVFHLGLAASAGGNETLGAAVELKATF